MKQEILNFQFLNNNKDFFVSPKNKIAFDYVQKWPKWDAKVTYIYGPEKCGKTLVSHMWADKSNAIFLDEIFLRELVSNSSDALDKFKFLTLTNDKFKNTDFTPRIDISFENNDNGKTITISDNGIGMDKKDLNQNLGTNARS